MIHLSRIGIAVAVVIAAIFWALYLIFSNERSLLWADAAPFGFVVSALVVVGLLFEHWLWYKKIVNWFLDIPDLRGTWKCEMRSNYRDETTHEPISPIDCYVSATQSFSYLQFHVMTPESQSWLIASDIRKSSKGTGYQVVGVYTNQPGTHVREYSEIHMGALWLETHGSNWRPDSMTGEYWTDRDTKGSITMSDRIDKVFSRFDEAETHFVKKPAK